MSDEVKAVFDACHQPQEKNCGNCAKEGYNGRNTCWPSGGEKYCWAWQPRPAKPHGWEQRFDDLWRSLAGGAPYVLRSIGHNQIWDRDFKAFIRAEIERAREEEKQAIIAHLKAQELVMQDKHSVDRERFEIGVQRRAIEQNKHR